MDIANGVYSDGLATSEMVTFCLVFDYVSVNDIVIGSYSDGFTTSEMVTVFNLIMCPWMIYCHWSIFKGLATSEMVTPAFIMPVAQSLSTHCKSGIVNSVRFLVFVNMFTASRNKMMNCSQNNVKWVISFVCVTGPAASSSFQVQGEIGDCQGETLTLE